MVIGDYGSWVVESEKAYLKADPEVAISLCPSDAQAVSEGWWGYPTCEKDLVSGICIFDARWALEFDNGKEAGTRKSLSLPREREKAFKMMEKGRKIKNLYVPTELSAYHLKLLQWQVKKICQLSPKRILYHLPVGEYEIFIQELETAAGIDLPWLYVRLEEISEKIKNYFLENLTRQGVDAGKVEFIRPLEMGAQSTDDSFGYPYLFPYKFGMSPESMMGLEDLVELRILLRAKMEMNYDIPVLCAVLEVPHPYLIREDNGGGVITVEN
ncbi:MAG: hypothetical protein WCX17_02325 [Parcubacteria group bacterium]|jgi:hypothetical protein